MAGEVTGKERHHQGERRPRRDRGKTRLGPRDLDVLRWIGEQYAVRLDQLARLLRSESLPLSEGATRAVLRRWERLGLAAHERMLVHEPGWAWLTANGLRALGLPYKAWTPTPGGLDHMYWVNEARRFIQRRDPGRAWTGERRLRADLPPGARARQLPDGLVELPGGDRVAVEVELTLKARNRYPAILDRLLRAHSAVWYFARRQAAVAIGETLAAFPEAARARIRVYGLEVLS